MAEICIQLDTTTLDALKTTAAKSHTSVSSWIENRIRTGLKQDWPEGYFSLFGSLDEEDLVEPVDIPFNYDSQREDI